MTVSRGVLIAVMLSLKKILKQLQYQKDLISDTKFEKNPKR